MLPSVVKHYSVVMCFCCSLFLCVCSFKQRRNMLSHQHIQVYTTVLLDRGADMDLSSCLSVLLCPSSSLEYFYLAFSLAFALLKS